MSSKNCQINEPPEKHFCMKWKSTRLSALLWRNMLAGVFKRRLWSCLVSCRIVRDLYDGIRTEWMKRRTGEFKTHSRYMATRKTKPSKYILKQIPNIRNDPQQVGSTYTFRAYEHWKPFECRRRQRPCCTLLILSSFELVLYFYYIFEGTSWWAKELPRSIESQGNVVLYNIILFFFKLPFFTFTWEFRQNSKSQKKKDLAKLWKI